MIFVDDEPEALELFEIIYSAKYDVVLCSSGKAAIEAARTNPDSAVVVMDIRMPNMDGVEALREVLKILPKAKGIFHTAFAGEYDEDEIDAREKPYEFVLKGESSTRLDRAIRHGVNEYLLESDNSRLIKMARRDFGLIGTSEVMRHLYTQVKKVSASDCKVLLLGESGTGKTRIAKAIHGNSSRAQARFYAYSCTGKPTEILESELFGHCKGAFTGAYEDRIGWFEYTHKGTILLDEIGDLDQHTQTKILKVVDEGAFSRLGETIERVTDVRLITATNRDINALVESGTFREDLYYRIEGVKITVPPLRKRAEDIRLLVNHFVGIEAEEKELPPLIVDESGYSVLEDYHWPGNVRQLETVVERLVLTSSSSLVTGDEVRNALELNAASDESDDLKYDEFMRRAERKLILVALRRADFVVAHAAQLLDISRQSLFRKIKEHGLDLDSLRDGDSASET